MVSHTEWHNCVVFGKLATFAGGLGTHVEIEGELRSREYTRQCAAEEQELEETEEFATEGVAA